MIEQMAKDFYNNLYALPPGHVELVEFAKLVLDKFIQELEDNKQTVAWNYGCDSVVFYNKDYGKESIDTIKEKYYVNEDDQSNSNESDGTGVERSIIEDTNGNENN